MKLLPGKLYKPLEELMFFDIIDYKRSLISDYHKSTEPFLLIKECSYSEFWNNAERLGNADISDVWLLYQVLIKDKLFLIEWIDYQDEPGSSLSSLVQQL
jgi:hypothetical protein